MLCYLVEGFIDEINVLVVLWDNVRFFKGWIVWGIIDVNIELIDVVMYSFCI